MWKSWEVWTVIYIKPRGRKRCQMSYWTRKAALRAVAYHKNRGAKVLYMVHAKAKNLPRK